MSMLVECYDCRATWPRGRFECSDCGGKNLVPYKSSPTVEPVRNPLETRLAKLERVVPELARDRAGSAAPRPSEDELKTRELIVEGLDQVTEKLEDVRDGNAPDRTALARGVSLAIVVTSFFFGLWALVHELRGAPAPLPRPVPVLSGEPAPVTSQP